jgi:transcriptional regulator with XRE-family HTH domain
LIDARDRAGLSQKELAEKIGIRRDSLLMVESGQRHPSFALMVRWAQALGVSLEVWDLEEEEEPESDICNVA